ncbi:MAG TPA: right-handed parallel beta-helix repeat-containing protein [Alphaproteobacteria bacterium]|nr:right-handed parallel beta-helix repeat-containing protein [Alphaproteobacteria bacterium]
MRAVACGVHALLAIVVLGGPVAAEEIDSTGLSEQFQLAQAQPQGLPPAPPPIGPLRRGPDGQIEVIAPPATGGHKQPGPCSAKSICVGWGNGPRTLAQALQYASDGALIEIVGGVYRESVAIDRNRITIRGVAGRPHFDCRGIRIADDKGCLLLRGEGITLDNLEISGAEIAPELGANGACVRNGRGRSFSIHGVICHDSQNGILTDGGSILIENSEFYDNGLAGRAHNVYLAGDCIEVTVRNSSFHDARGGHEFKSRCRRTTILDSSFQSTRASRNIDVPDGGETFIYNTLLSKSLGSDNVEFVAFAAESCRHPGPMHLRRVRIINRHPRGAITNFDKCHGQPIIIEEATFEGYKLQLNGGVLLRDRPGSPAGPPPTAERAPRGAPAQPPPERRRIGPLAPSQNIAPPSYPEPTRRAN